VSAAPAPLLVVVDVQRVVVRADSPWRIDGLEDRLPAIVGLAEAFAPDVVFTRHVPPADGGTGTWRRFYRAWSGLSDPALWERVPELAGIPGVDAPKSIYSCFGAPALKAELERRGGPPLVLCGAETDCCVLATVLEAVDRGLEVIVAEDAVASPDATAHAGALALCRRLDQQVRVAPAAELAAAAQAGRR
jgi:nicotinamidase-related amidase